MKAYLFVDLCYGAIVDFWRVPLLTGWVHHIAYFYVMDHMLAIHQDGIIRPFLVAELPTAILAWGHLVPVLRADLLFGVTFFVTRIAMPMVFVASMSLPIFIWNVIGVALTVHVYWFGRWVASVNR